MNRYFLRGDRDRARSFKNGLFSDEEYEDVGAFYAAGDNYPPTPLRRLSLLASTLGIGELLVKDESRRFGHESFKILGVGYAVDRLLASIDSRASPVLGSATDGNHGHALARVARERGVRARIYVHALTREERIQAIRDEGADVIVVSGNYDDAVRVAAEDANRSGWYIVSDTTWEGYTQIPRWIMAGYTQMMRELSIQWQPSPQPDIVIVQAGVGGLACSVSSWFARWYKGRRPFMIVCEPSNAACLLESALAGRPATVTGSLETVMEGLSCGEVSTLAWPAIASTVDAYVSIDDIGAIEAMRILSSGSVGDAALKTGASGAAGVGALLALLQDPALARLRAASGINADSRVLVFNTEGAIGDPFRAAPAR